ncbi:uncharacterized protein LOC108680386 [Hyalella azteca]|uniref:Uncharacterized protein LOC108680386 n=1 Tax=Hyalella azteca TaxID=294128 RepID=A0A8B7PEY8_HYAAZ|nr:uncharacterized protein LOC108680386 [Hyalella azteca]
MKTFAGLSLAFVAVLSVVSNGNCEGTERATNYRYFHGYAESNQGGVNYDFLTYSPDLSLVNMDNAIKSACQIGLWILYDNIEYNHYTSGTVCYGLAVDTCFELPSLCSAQTSSLRFAGSPYGLNEPYFNLYEGKDFQGIEFRGNHTTSSVAFLDMDVSSLIITGVDGWTLFTGPEFTGGSVCAIPDILFQGADGTVINYGTFSTLSDLSLADNSIRSLKQGCHSDTVVSAKAVKDKREKEAIGGK